MIDYRNEARRELARAKGGLAATDYERLKYAGIELRMAMAIFLEIDPNADKDSSLAFGIDPSLGVRPDMVQSLGIERFLNMDTIKRRSNSERTAQRSIP